MRCLRYSMAYCGTFVNTLGVVVSYECGVCRVRVILITPASIPLFYLQTSDTYRELTVRTVILNGHSTILRD